MDEQFKQMFTGVSQPAPATVITSIDMTDADSFRKKIQKESEIYIIITSLITKAAASTVEDFPL